MLHVADIILIHGSISQKEDLVLGLMPILASQRRVTAFDRPGHGESGVLGNSGSPWRQAASLHAAAEALGLRAPVVIGHSFGAAVAIAYGLQFPNQTSGVVALAPPAFPEPRLEQLIFGPRALSGLGDLANLTVGTVVDAALLPAMWRGMFLPQEMPPQFAHAFPFEQAALRRQMRSEGQDASLLPLGLGLTLMNGFRCRVPVEIFGGDCDVVVDNRRHGMRLALWLRNANYTSLAGLGHMVHHFAQDQIAQAAFAMAA